MYMGSFLLISTFDYRLFISCLVVTSYTICGGWVAHSKKKKKGYIKLGRVGGTE